MVDASTLLTQHLIFYGYLQQPIQIILGWKRIRGSDVATCYQQAAGLALMVEDNLDRLLLGECIKIIADDNTLFEKFQAIEDPEKLFWYLLRDTLSRKNTRERMRLTNFFDYL